LISTLVVLETESVLRSRYGFDRLVVHALFRRMLQTRELSFEGEDGLEEALFNWESSPCGLPTVRLQLTTAGSGAGPTATFDVKAAKLSRMVLI